jgi:L-aminopeptidase/D-esterase-like protein
MAKKRGEWITTIKMSRLAISRTIGVTRNGRPYTNQGDDKLALSESSRLQTEED